MTVRLDEFSSLPSPDRIAFRMALCARMAALHVSAAELSRRAHLSKDAISSYTKMRSMPTPDSLAKLATALDCTPKQLLGTPQESGPRGTMCSISESAHPGFLKIQGRMMVTMSQAAEVLRLLDHRPAHHAKAI